jgi:hypothetical protein
MTLMSVFGTVPAPLYGMGSANSETEWYLPGASRSFIFSNE